MDPRDTIVTKRRMIRDRPRRGALTALFQTIFSSLFFQIVVHKCDRAKSTILKMFIFVATTKKKKSRNKHDPWNDDYAIENLFFFFYLYFSFPRFY